MLALSATRPPQVGAVKQIIEAELPLVGTLENARIVRGRAAAQRDPAPVEIEVVVLQLERPVSRQGELHAGAGGPAAAGTATCFGAGRRVLEVIGIGKRGAALDVEQGRIERVAGAAGRRGDPVLPGAAVAHAVRTGVQ